MGEIIDCFNFNDCFNYQKGDYVTIRKVLENICWEEKFKGKTVTYMKCGIFLEMTLSALETN